MRLHLVIVSLAFLLAAAAAAAAAAEAPSSAQLLWEAGLSSHFPGTTTTRLPSAKSTVIGPSSAYQSAAERDLARLTLFYTRTPPPEPSGPCAGNAGLSCCRSFDGSAFSPTFDCLLHISWQDSNDLPNSLLRGGFATFVLHLFAQELARSSTAITLKEFQAAKVPHNQLLYQWRLEHLPNDRDVVLLTRVDADLMNRLATTISLLLPQLRKAIRSPNRNDSAFICTAGGFHAFAGRREDFESAALLEISSGHDSSIRRPRLDRGIYASTVRIRSDAGSTLVEMVQRATTPVGGRNTALIDYFELLWKDKRHCFSCFGQEDQTDALVHIRNQLNSSESALLFFDLFYLQAVWESEALKSLTPN